MEENCQVIDIVKKSDVPRPLIHKSHLRLAKKKKCFITMIYHINTRDIPVRQYVNLYVTLGTSNLQWSILHSNILQKWLLSLYEKL